MRNLFTFSAISAAAAVLTLAAAAQVRAGEELEGAAGKDKIVVPEASKLPPAMLTLGGKFSDGLASGYLDSVLPFWAPHEVVLFLNTRTTLADNHQTLGSYGLGARYLVPGHDIIVGANAYYDAIHSMYGNDFDQLGLGAEVLTKWVDGRFNYYLPDDSKYEVDRTSRESVDRRYSPIFRNLIGPKRILLQRERVTTTRKTTVKRYEAALEGWNAEVGFLVPGLDKYLEMRVFAGAYGYSSAVGKDYSGFKARAEAHLLPGVIADVEYWDDTYLTGGHWTGEVRVTVPFSIFNLASGRNPFEGAGEMFKPRQREFSERVTDMVLRSHRVYTTTGTDGNGSTTSGQATATVGAIDLKPDVRSGVAAPLPPQVGQGEGGDE
jgi:hypothetical protein